MNAAGTTDRRERSAASGADRSPSVRGELLEKVGRHSPRRTSSAPLGRGAQHERGRIDWRDERLPGSFLPLRLGT
jgi:hypothetical protein